jgi:hypothetical protein
MAFDGPVLKMGLPGFGLDMLADFTHGDTWHIGVLAAPGIAEMVLVDRERESLGQFAFPAMSATPERSPIPTSTSLSVLTTVPVAGAERSAFTSPCSEKATRSQPLSPATN